MLLRVMSSLSVRSTMHKPCIALAASVLLGLLAQARPATAQQTFTSGGSSGSPTINFNPTSTGQSASSTINVTNPGGSAVKTVSVTLNGLTTTGQDENGNFSDASLYSTVIYLKGPGGQEIVLLGDTGNGCDGGNGSGGDGVCTGTSPSNPASDVGLSGATVTIEDSATILAPLNTNYWTPKTGSFTVQPSSYTVNSNGGEDPSLPLTGPSYPTTDGNATLTSVFGGAATAGNWTLYVYSDWSASPIVINTWSLTLTYAVTTSVATTTTLTSSAQPANITNNNAITLKATVTADTTGTPPVTDGTVTFTATPTPGGTAVTLCSNVSASTGTATCNTTGSALRQGTSVIQATYTPGTGYLASSTTMTQLVEVAATQPSSDTWCNTSTVTVGADSVPQAYPSIISIPTGSYAAGTTVSSVSVQLMGLNGTSGVSGQYLLVAPPTGGQNLDIMDDLYAEENTPAVNLTIQDDASDPNLGSIAQSGTFKPYDNALSGTTDSFAASPVPTSIASVPQVPATINHPPSYGSAANTFAASFNNAPAMGDWALYVSTENGAGAQALSGGWCVNLTINTGNPTVTKVTPTQNPAATNQSVTYTATVTSSGSPVTSGGTVTFEDNNTTPQGGTTSNVVPLSTSGTAPFTSSSLYDVIEFGATPVDIYEGDHAMSAGYSGSSSDNPSTGTLVERINNATAFTNNGGNSYSACNSGPIYLNQGNTGPFTPNPSVISAANIPGTINSVSLTLENFSTYSALIIPYVESLVEGPTGKALDFFSGTGYNTTNNNLTQGNYVFADGNAAVPSGSFGPGTYEPTSYLSGDTYTSSVSGFYPAPTSFNYSQPQGTSTFTNTFGNTNPNGTWSLFFNEKANMGSAGAAKGWCLNFTENVVSVTVDESHAGDGTGGDLVQGETGAQITTSIVNDGQGPTGDPTGTNKLTLTDTLNSALTYTGFTGTNWSCSASGQTITCTNDSAIAQGSAYPTLTLDVNVASTATVGTFTNTVNVSGAGIKANSGSDTVRVDAAPVLAIAKSHSGNFTQGQTGQWNLVVSNTSSSGATGGTVTVSDTLPTGYTLGSYTSTSGLWTCLGPNPVTCTATPGLAGGSSSTITLTVNVPANSPISVSNSASVWGGGDLVHTSAATAAHSNTDTATVVQVPANLIVTSGSGQSTLPNTAFANPLIATVTDAGNNPVPGYNVTFTGPAGHTPAVIFSNNSNSISAATGATGQANSGVIAANSVHGGPYNVQASAGALTANYQLTNLYKTTTSFASLTVTAATVDVFGYGFAAPAGQLSLTDLTTGNPLAVPVTLNTANAVTALSPMTTTSTGALTYPDWTVLGDLNGDGIPDLVTSLYNTDSISVQLSNGNGTFQPATVTHISTGFGPAEAHLVSLRGNGTLDIIVGSFNLNQIAVLLGNGNGTFQPPVFYTVGTASNWTSSLTTGDFNHDNNLDVAVANTGDGTVSILLGNGTGALAVSGSPIDVGNDPQAIRAGDFTGSGYSDLAVANYDLGTVTTLLNNQSGGFTSTTLSVGSGAKSGPVALAITGTGTSLRLAVANYKDNTVSVMSSNGNGTFGAQTIVAVGKGPDDVNFADFNGDGIPDLSVVNYSGSSVNLLLGKSGGGYTVQGPFSVGTGPYNAAVADIDQDGTPDVVVSNCFSNNTGVLLDGTLIVVPYTGLTLTAGHSIQASYTPGATSSYGASTAPVTTAP